MTSSAVNMTSLLPDKENLAPTLTTDMMPTKDILDSSLESSTTSTKVCMGRDTKGKANVNNNKFIDVARCKEQRSDAPRLGSQLRKPD